MLKLKKILSIVITVVCFVVFNVNVIASANTNDDVINIVTTTFNLSSHVTQEQKITLANGYEGIVGLEFIEPTIESYMTNDLSNRTWKIYFYGVGINIHYYINIHDSKITDAYGLSFFNIGWAVQDSSLTYTSKKSTGYLNCFYGVGSIGISSTFRLNATISGNKLITSFTG